MASDHSDAIQVKPEDLYDPSEDGMAGSKVQIDEVEEAKPSEVKNIDTTQGEGEEQETPAAKDKSSPVTHETETVKSTYTEEEPKLTTKAKIKDKVSQLGDKLRSKDAVEAKNADPHPGML